MYIPRLYRQEDRAEILAFLKTNGFPALVSHDSEKPVATHIPVELLEGPGEQLTFLSHMARANKQWRSFRDQEVLLIFQGPHTYISPRWYDHTNVPTWNYMMAHVYGRVRPVEGDELYNLLSRLVQRYEAGTDYSLEGLPQEYVQREMQGVYGFAVEVTRIDAAFKLSQNRDDENHASIVAQLEQRSDENSHQVAAAMRRGRHSAG
ncbi:MAG: FMN-binding negative transcriptional regulator [Anaerolineales bacterium]|nr:FMN-binding negative transcriptional regulator [Anaerolineales bacterium]